MIPKLVSVLAWVSVVFAALASAWWVWYVFFVEYNFLFDVVFTLIAAPANIAVLLLAVIPSAIRYSRTAEQRSLVNLFLSGSSFVIVLVEIILLWTVIKLHGA